MGNELYQIFEFIDQHYDISELKILCFRLEDVEYENLPAEGEGKRGHARELVKYLARRERLPELLVVLKKERPELFEKSGLGLGMLLTQQSALEFLADEIVTTSQFSLDKNYYDYYILPEHEEKIDQIMGTLFLKDSHSVTMISGLGGIGKTAVTIELIRRILLHKESSFKKITWDSAKQQFYEDGKVMQVKHATISWEALFDSIGRQLVGSTWQQSSNKDKEMLLCKQLQDTPSLIVVDNLESLTNADEIIFQLKGLLGASKLLLTSRELVVGNYYQAKLDGLSLESTGEFLRGEIDRRQLELYTLTESELHRIHLATGGMPLALKLVIGQAAMLNLETALKNFASGQDDIYDFVYFQIWNGLSSLAKKILMYMAVNPYAVGWDELERVAKKSKAELNELTVAINQLMRASLVNKQELLGTGKTGYTIHQVTRQFIMNDLRKYLKQKKIS